MKTLIWIALAAILLGLAAYLSAPSAGAHDAPSGWAYDLSCCSNTDCQQLAPGSVKITPAGYEWDGEIFPVDSSKLKSSPDGYFHGCKAEAGNLHFCLYVPPQAF